MREELANAFDLEGYVVWQAPDCESARAKLATAHPDAILLDLQLPDGDGMDLLPWILREHPGIPVVIGTSSATYEKAVRAIRLGAYDFIEKTVDREQLLLPIRNAVEKRKLERVQAALRRNYAVISTWSPRARQCRICSRKSTELPRQMRRSC
ncbi:MAG: response regulator [bacterium]|nr:response regulator [bacterium]